MGNDFLFIDGVHADRSAKRQMRRHVMKGKNAGKKFYRPSKLPPVNPKIISDWGSSEVPSQTNTHERVKSVVDEKFGDDFHAFGIPVHVSSAGRQIINNFFMLTAERMYPAKLGISLEKAKYMWLKVLFEDQATYECNLAVMESCNEIYLGRGDSSSRALHALSLTISHVKSRLESPRALSDSTISLVLSLISQEQLKKFDSQAKLHLDGLRRIIELRGGLEQLEGKAPLLLKICKVDVLFALQHGGSTIFFRDQMVRVREELASKGFLPDHASELPSIYGDVANDILGEILLDVLDVSKFINSRKLKQVINLVTFQEILMSVFYRLLRLHPLDDAPLDSDADAAYHLGLTIFMMTLFITLEKQRILECSLVSECLREILDRDLSKLPAGLVLWLLQIGGIWTSKSEGDWMVPKLLKIKRSLRLGDWNQVRSCIKPFPWIDVVHDQPGRSLWNQVSDLEDFYNQQPPGLEFQDGRLPAF